MALKIGISTTSIEPQITHHRTDGIGNYTMQLYQKLNQAGYDLSGYAFNRLGCKITKPEFGQTFPYRLETTTILALLTANHFPRFKPDVDVFHFTDFKICPTQCPSVASIHDTITLAHPEWYGLRTRILGGRILKRLVKSVDHFITGSNYAAEEAIKYLNINPNKITTVYNSIDDLWHQPIDQTLTENTLAKHQLEPGYILNVGTIQPKKNIDRLIKAYLKLPKQTRKNHKLVIAGKYGWCCPDLKKHLLSEEIKNQGILWLSNVASNLELQHLYHNASMFVFPSLHEGFGLPLLEAFASKVPVITSNTTSLPEISARAAIEIDPLSIDQLTEAMEALATNSSLREHHIKLGLKRLKDFSWDKTLKETLAVYDKVLNG